MVVNEYAHISNGIPYEYTVFISES